jgi:hypothetical protein
MSSASATGFGKGSEGEDVTMADVLRHLQANEDIVCPMQPLPDALAALEATVHE